jgi:rfaE bifunctional protein nucleotidyltransferase chain/domain
VSPDQKILTRDDLLRRYGRPRSCRVVFTNGCFDLLHRGHVAYLSAARSLGDVLIVGVNTDASVRRLAKEGSRPLIREEDRAYVLASLACVDAVTLFDEDTPLSLIAALLPDVLVKGSDYAADDVVGRREVEDAGGRLALIPIVEGYSTTSLIQRIRGG